jgi:hypothetical protein
VGERGYTARTPGDIPLLHPSRSRYEQASRLVARKRTAEPARQPKLTRGGQFAARPPRVRRVRARRPPAAPRPCEGGTKLRQLDTPPRISPPPALRSTSRCTPRSERSSTASASPTGRPAPRTTSRTETRAREGSRSWARRGRRTLPGEGRPGRCCGVEATVAAGRRLKICYRSRCEQGEGCAPPPASEPVSAVSAARRGTSRARSRAR